MSKPYVLVWRSDIDPGTIKIVGPFETESRAASWGRVWQKAHQDNPCWQVISLDDGTFSYASINDGPFVYSGGPILILPVRVPGTPEANS
jgi:hypothetical protein